MKNRFPLLLLVLLFLVLPASTPVLSGGTFKCLVRKTCPAGTPPGKCCDPPPCEIFDQIRTKKALQALFRDKSLRQQMIRKAKGNEELAATLLHQEIKDQASKMGSKLQCGWNGKVQSPPSFETSGECSIQSPTGAMGRETAHKTFNTCSEFIEAAYDHEEFHKKICFDMNSTERAHMKIGPFADEEVKAYQKEIDRLMSELKSYWSACSPSVDPKTARELAALGIKALKKKGSK